MLQFSGGMNSAELWKQGIKGKERSEESKEEKKKAWTHCQRVTDSFVVLVAKYENYRTKPNLLTIQIKSASKDVKKGLKNFILKYSLVLPTYPENICGWIGPLSLKTMSVLLQALSKHNPFSFYFSEWGWAEIDRTFFPSVSSWIASKGKMEFYFNILKLFKSHLNNDTWFFVFQINEAYLEDLFLFLRC